MFFLFLLTNQKQESGFQQVGGLVTRNISVFCLQRVALYFKAIPSSIDFYKEIFLHVIPVRVKFHGYNGRLIYCALFVVDATVSKDTPLTRPSFTLIRPFFQQRPGKLTSFTNTISPVERFGKWDDVDDRTDVVHVTQEYIHHKIFC